MARRYQLGRGRRLANVLMSWLARLGLPSGGAELLTTRGRKSGRAYTTPVKPITFDGRRWLVSPYGLRSWVLNVRANGEARLRHGRRVERLTVTEVDAATAAPVLKRYLETTGIVAPYFDVRAGDPVAVFVAEAASHPVFRIDEATGPSA